MLLEGVKLVISDAHEELKAAVAEVLNASWRRCRVHFMRNVLAHAGRQGRRVVVALVATAFAQDDAEAVRKQWRQAADQLRPRVPKLAATAVAVQPLLMPRLWPLGGHAIRRYRGDAHDRQYFDRGRWTEQRDG